MGRPRKIVLPVLSLSEVCNETDPGAVKRCIPPNQHTSGYCYYYRPLTAGSTNIGGNTSGTAEYNYNRFPVVLDGDGVPWDVAALYILARVDAAYPLRMSTYDNIAADLAAYLLFIEDAGLDFTEFPRMKLHRPTYRYNGSLRIEIQAEAIKWTTASRRMNEVVALYRWLEEEGIVRPSNPPWKESERFFRFTGKAGAVMSKRVVTSDVAIKTPRQNDIYSEMIDDGGRLRPLPPNEQLLVFRALESLCNPEMTLIHLVAVLTGARIQTILTLRVKHVGRPVSDSKHVVPLHVGPGYGVDTKNDKRMTIFLPFWLYEKLSLYADSSRARTRRHRAVGGDIDDQFLFISKNGAPLYQAKHDATVFDPANRKRYARNGQAVRQFMTERLIPEVRKSDPSFRFKFHDLRATFGMNLTDHLLQKVELGEMTLHEAREEVKTRMCHQSSDTTDRYLNYRQNLSHTRAAQSDFERHLMDLSDSAMRGVL